MARSRAGETHRACRGKSGSLTKPGSGRRTRSPVAGPKRGARPAAPSDQRTASTYIFGAICPTLGKGAALVLPRCDTAAMNLHLAEIAMAVAPGAHAVLLLDQAGWHLSDKLIAPPNITLLPLPPKCPELNPVENVWQFIRDNWLSNRVFRSYEDILEHCCDAWADLSIGLGPSCPSVCASGHMGSDPMGVGIRHCNHPIGSDCRLVQKTRAAVA